MNKSNKAALLSALSAIAAVIAIFGFVTGIFSLPQLLRGHSSSNSAAHSTPTSTPPTASLTTLPTSNVIYSNSLLSPASGWQTDQYCSFESDGYHVKQSICSGPVSAVGDFEMSVRVKEIAGTNSTGYGIDFRGICTQSPCQGGYTFSITSGGSWYFIKCSPDCNAFIHQSSPAILTGLNTWNTIDVRAIGHHFQFYVNGMEVGQTDDYAFQRGNIALDSGITPECVFAFLSVSSA
jgi:hypothetical protein